MARARRTCPIHFGFQAVDGHRLLVGRGCCRCQLVLAAVRDLGRGPRSDQWHFGGRLDFHRFALMEIGAEESGLEGGMLALGAAADWLWHLMVERILVEFAVKLGRRWKSHRPEQPAVLDGSVGFAGKGFLLCKTDEPGAFLRLTCREIRICNADRYC